MISNMLDVITILQTIGGGAPLGDYIFTPGPIAVNDGHGRMVDQPPGPSFTATCSVQPVRGKTLELLPQGARASDWWDVYAATTTLITASDAQTGRKGHTVAIGGLDYEVRIAHDWRVDGGYQHLLVEKRAR